MKCLKVYYTQRQAHSLLPEHRTSAELRVGTKGQRAQELCELLLKDPRPNPSAQPCFIHARSSPHQRWKPAGGLGSAATLAGGTP